jgi:heme/copper-type cytochrome/quinol oxidase subunit 4
MCFSPTISFAASAVLTVIGIFTIRKISVRGELLLASVPFLFAIQQFTEGLLWLVLLKSHSSTEQYWLTQLYSTFVGVIWPVLIPLSILLIEPDNKRKRMMLAFVLIGACVAAYTMYVIVKFGVTSKITDNCILYDDPITQGSYTTITYVIATCTAFFFSSYRSIKQLGLLYSSTFLIAYYFYRLHYVSVWCFFAASFSGALYIHLNRRLVNKPPKKNAVLV